ncbi:hypothetical protein D3C87_2121650 [compost metagenome]
MYARTRTVFRNYGLYIRQLTHCRSGMWWCVDDDIQFIRHFYFIRHIQYVIIACFFIFGFRLKLIVRV